MNKTQLQQNLYLIKLKSQQLRQEIARSDVSLSEHCLRVKRKIDLQMKRLLDEINMIKANTYTEIEAYERETLKSLAADLPIFEFNFRKLCAELSAFESLCVQNADNDTERLLNLSREYLAKIETRKVNLNWVKFNNRIINFEPNMTRVEESKLFGATVYTQANQPSLQFDSNEILVASSNYMSIEIPKRMNMQKASSARDVSSQGVRLFDDEKFLYYSFESLRGLRLTVFTKDLKLVSHSVGFECVDLGQFLLATCGQRAVLYLNFSTGTRYLLILNNNRALRC
jgi:hypothetical protein